MATFEANTIQNEPLRPLANFSPSVWGDRFISFSLDNVQLEAYGKAIEEHKEKLKILINDPSMDSNGKLSLIYSVYRLGLSYLLLEDIEGELDKLFNEVNVQDYHEANLYTISVHFQVFRNFGYKLSCDVFNKFKDCNSGEFKEYITKDVRTMLSFYEASQLRIRGESILDEAFEFTNSQLRGVEKTLQGNLAGQVKHALHTPLYRGYTLVEARKYLIHYEEECSKYDSLLKLAKVHFNYLQLLHQEELRIVSKWWKDMDFRAIAPHVRDRVPELYVWILAFFLEPCYSQARIITTKMVTLVLLLDDTYDAYGTITELRLLTHALNRWDISATAELPEYFKPLYESFLNEFVVLEKQVAKQGRADLVKASKEAFQELARSYLQEAEWRHSGEMPTFEEYMKNGLITSTEEQLTKSALIGMFEIGICTKEILAWYESKPNILTASKAITRLQDDLSTFQFERERGLSSTAIDAYVKSFGVSEDVAIKDVTEMVENAWKDLNEGYLKPRTVPVDLLSLIVNFARSMDVVYRYGDGLTLPEKVFTDIITFLFDVEVPA